MIQNTALEVAIGLILMYLTLSLLCTVVNEGIASTLRIRGHSLKLWLQEIIDDPGVRERFYRHGLIAGHKNAVAKLNLLVLAKAIVLAVKPFLVWTKLVRPTVSAMATTVAPAAAADATSAEPPPRKHPPYIGSIHFASALLGSLDINKPSPQFGDVVAVVAEMENNNLKTALLCAMATAKGDLDQLRKNVANWFDDSMEQLSGVYKRYLKFISFFVGVIVAISFNADSLRVTETLWNDSDRRAHVIAAANAAAPKTAISDAQLVHAINQLHSLPIGWNCNEMQQLPCEWGGWLKLTLQILGWLLTATAVSLGAAFWFDLLTKFMNIRGTGIRPARADAKK